MTALNLHPLTSTNIELKSAMEPFSGFKNIWRMKKLGFLEFYRELWREHGDLVYYKMGHFDAIFVAHPDLVREIIVDKQRDFIKGPSYDGLRLFAGNGLLTASGEDWIAQRRMVKGEFTPDAIRLLHQDMCSAIDKSCKIFDKAIKEKRPVKIFEAMRMLAMNVVSTTLFGREFNHCDELNDAFAVVLEIAAIKSITPLGTLIYLPTLTNWRFLEARKKINRITDDFIAKNLPSRSEKEPLITRLVVTAKKHYQGRALKNYLRDQINTIFLAGHETTANTLGWIWTHLAANPLIEKRLVSELDVYHSEWPKMSDLSRLPLTRNIAMETLRLYPPVWALMRDVQPEATLSTIKISAKTRMVISPYFVHRHPDFWSDPERFDPDRFTNFAENTSLTNAYLPFSYGSRKCIGDHFASLEMSVAVAILAKRYRFTPMADMPKAVAEMTLRPECDVSMMISHR